VQPNEDVPFAADVDQDTLAERMVDASVEATPALAIDGGRVAVPAACTDPEGGNTGIPVICTDLKGEISEIGAGTYCVTGDVIIPNNTVLRIPAGTEFVFMSKHHFGKNPIIPDDVYSGVGLEAIGTAEQPIVFRGATPEIRWWGILIDKSSVAVRLEYVTIRDALKDDSSPISAQFTRGGGLGSVLNLKGTIIRNCKFIHNEASTVGGAIHIDGNGTWGDSVGCGLVEITNTLFKDNSCDCQYIDTPSSDDRCGGGAIRLTQLCPNFKLEGNAFCGNRAQTGRSSGRGGALSAWMASDLNVGKNNVFSGNAANAEGAISCAGRGLGTGFASVDPSNSFVDNKPDIGCGL
jgi:hypothetical protein